jgi:hypothetical protein
MTSRDKAGEVHQAVSRPAIRPRTRPGRVILGWIVAYALALAALALAGYEEALRALWLPGSGLAGYGLGYFACRFPGRRGETIANVIFFGALGVLTIVALFIVVSRPAETSSPWWLGILGFVSGVLAASYIRLKHYSLER